MGILDDIGEGLLGESASSARDRLTNNEFRQVGAPGQFISGNIAGAQGQLGGLQRQIAGRQFSDFRGGQQNFIQGLQNQFAGRGPGQDIARLQAQQQANRGIQQQLAMQAGQRGAGATLGARGAASNAANITGQAAQTATLGGLQAQLMAGQQLGSALQGARGQDQGFMQLGQQGQLEALRQQAALAQLEQQGMQAREQARTQRFGALAGVSAANLPTGAQQLAGSATGLLGAFGLGGSRNR